MIKRICKICKKIFYTSNDRIKTGRGKYCSRKCFSIAWGRIMSIRRTKDKIKKRCKFCNKNFKVLQTRINNNRGKFCSLQCKYSFGHTQKSKDRMSKSRKGKPAWNKNRKCPQWSGNKNSRYKGKIIDKDGYILIYFPNHPYSRGARKNYVLEHRLVMEKYLGRYLKPTEIVHHINHIKNDNRIENLKLFSNNKEHIRYHKNFME